MAQPTEQSPESTNNAPTPVRLSETHVEIHRPKRARASNKSPKAEAKSTTKKPVAKSKHAAIEVSQYGGSTKLEFTNEGDLRMAWNDIAYRIQNGQAVQIQNHIFVGALRATVIEGDVPETRSNRRARRRAENQG